MEKDTRLSTLLERLSKGLWQRFTYYTSVLLDIIHCMRQSSINPGSQDRILHKPAIFIVFLGEQS
jgi:hypothetical protein